MILIDTAIWCDHLGVGEPRLEALLREDLVVMHPYVMAELALGSLPDRAATQRRLARLPSARLARHEGVMTLIESELTGTGIGYVDAHLVASVLLTGDTIWTRDKRLLRVAERMGVAAAIQAH